MGKKRGRIDQIQLESSLEAENLSATPIDLDYENCVSLFLDELEVKKPFLSYSTLA